MSLKAVGIEKREHLPHPDNVSVDKSYVQVGCFGCEHTVAVEITGYYAPSIGSEIFSIAADHGLRAMFTSALSGEAVVGTTQRCPSDCNELISDSFRAANITIER